MIREPGRRRTGETGARSRFAAASRLALAAGMLVPGVVWAQAQPVAIEEVVVTGSHIQANGFQSPSPQTVVGAQLIETRAPTAIADVLNQLPQFRNSVSTTTNTRGPGGAGSNVLDLRGLGGLRTLVLLDGRRLLPTSASNTIDTNMIPSILLDRVDVVTGGASAAYGSDAVAGVVNLILNDKLNGLHVRYNHGQSDLRDNVENFAGIAWGGDFAEKGHIVIGAEGVKNSGVGNFYSRAWGRQEPGVVALTASRPAGLPAQLISNGVEYATMTPGGVVLKGPLAGLEFLPGGQTTTFTQGPLIGGNQMIGSTANYGDSNYGYQSLKAPIDRGSALVHADWDLTDKTTIWAEAGLGYLKAHLLGQNNYFRDQNLIITADNAFLPASVRQAMLANHLNTITIGRTNDEIGPVQGNNQTNQYRLAFGAKGSLGDWNWNASYDWGHSKFKYDAGAEVLVANYNAATYAVRDATGAIVCGPAASNPNLSAAQRPNVQPGCVPFNPFGYGSPSQAALDYVIQDEVAPTWLTQQSAQVNFSGAPVQLPAGPLAVAFGAEARRQEATLTQSPFSTQFNVGNVHGYAGKLTVVEAYAEADAPLLKDAPLAKTLSINSAVRETHYSLSGSVTTWKVGTVWEPVDGLRFRATRSHDIRAPTLAELYNAGFTVPSQLRNSLTGASGLVPVITRGNPSLRPEEANTTTVGVVIQPTWSWARPFRLSVDYYDIDVNGVITFVQAQDTVDRCLIGGFQQYCNMVTRDNSSVGISGVVVTAYNLNSLRTDGFDIEGDYQAPLDALNVPGHLDLRALGTWTRHLTTIFGSGASGMVENAGVQVPKWRWDVSATYRLDNLTVNLQAIAFTDTKYSATLVGPGDPGYNPALPNSINMNRFPGLAYFNGAVQYDLTAFGARHVQLFANIDNLFNRQPPFGAILNQANVYDLVGRTSRVGFRLDF